jgi:hypothetical protein
MVSSFLMIGQSNMAGRGRLEDVPPIKNEKLFMLRNGRWQPLSEPVNYDRPFAGVGLAPAFADVYSKQFGLEAGLIPCADGGSGLDEWAPGGQLYSHALALTRLAQKVSEVKAILWHQGEAESGSIEKARSYKSRFLDMLFSLQKECGLEGVPVILGELGSFLGEYPAEDLRHYSLVNKALAEIAASNPGIGLAGAEGLRDIGDKLHFDAQSCRVFGGRYFQKYLELTGKAAAYE